MVGHQVVVGPVPQYYSIHYTRDSPALAPGHLILPGKARFPEDYRAATRSRRVSISLSSIDLGSSDEPRFSSTSARARLSMAGIIA